MSVFPFLTFSTAELYATHFFPDCVDIVDIYPYPNSVLKPLPDNKDLYAVQITFSKPIKSKNFKYSSFLSPFLSFDLMNHEELRLQNPLHAYYVHHSWQGNERSLMFIFKVVDTQLKSQ